METLNQILKWTTAILSVVVACAGIGALITSNILTARKDAKITALETKAAPRALNEEQQNRIVAELKPFGSQIYDLSVPPTLEPGSSLIGPLIHTLKVAGWTLKSQKEAG